MFTRRNARLDNSLIDYMIECGGNELYLEVKRAVVRERDYAMYPDCPTLRGKRHIEGLAEHIRRGERAVIMFIAALPEIRAFKPSQTADPELYESLIEVREVGVEIRAIGMVHRSTDLMNVK